MSKSSFIIYALVLLFMSMSCVLAQATDQNWAPLASRIGKSDALIVSAPDGTILFAKNENEKMVPASTLKILTALVAFEHLGPEYRFPTEFYVDGSGNLIIKGYGDPFLVSEEVRAICRVLAGKVENINDIVIDESYFEQSPVVPGIVANSLQPYDAPVGAMCVNFNTVFYKKENGRFKSAEEQTPLLPTAIKRITKTSSDSGRILLSQYGDELIRYAGELFRFFLEESGVGVRGTIRSGNVDTGNQLIYRHKSSFSLEWIVNGLMEYSNNFIANQLLLAAGAKASGPPASFEKGLRAAKSYAGKTIGIDPVMVEGSGISRQNKMTAAMFVPILNAFEPHLNLMKQNGRVYYKTGTLSGIQSRAGYIRAADGNLYRFALLVNTPGKLADPIVDIVRRILDQDIAQNARVDSAS